MSQTSASCFVLIFCLNISSSKLGYISQSSSLKYPYSYFLNIEYTLYDNLSIVFYQKGYIFIVTVYILWYSKAKEMNA
nr:MAG TPA: hypothetical protein [Caudoviricetes sp.]